MFRSDRFITLHIVYPFRRCVFPLSRKNIPILMYHSISDETEDWVNPYFRVTTPSALFERHIQVLSEMGYCARPLRNLDEMLKSSISSRKFVVLTFDDGFRDFYTNAWPIMKKYGFSGTVFLPVKFIDDIDNELIKGKKHLTWDQIRELDSQGIEFGSHTINHLQLRDCSKDIIRREIVDSKIIIEKKLGKPVFSFSYPFSLPFNDKKTMQTIIGSIGEAGYRYSVGTKVGTVTKVKNKGILSRLPINSMDDESFFKAKLGGAYNWLAAPQYIYKSIKQLLNLQNGSIHNKIGDKNIS